MKHDSPIPGISQNVFRKVLALQYSKESLFIIGDADSRQSTFFEVILFFIGIAYSPVMFRREIEITEHYLSQVQHHLSHFELGIYYHVRGFLFIKKGPNHYHIAFESLNRSIDYLNIANIKAARYYRSRVSDTYAQVLQTIGFYKDALLLFQESLKIKKEFNDEPSVALTHGNLGRLYFGIGNFKQAIKHLELDLKILEKSAGEESLKSKMMNQIASCLVELEDFQGAIKYIDRSIENAKKAGSEIEFYALYTLAYYYLQTHEVVKSRQIISRLRKISGKENNRDNQKILQSRIDYLLALMALFNGKPFVARKYFHKTEEAYMNDFTNSITEKAHFYYYQSQALDKSGYYNESSLQLRKAISLLDQTENTALRKEFESTLKERHKDGWLLHAAGRFIGQEQIEIILNETGREGFQGKSSNIAILFSDIRDFTKLSENSDANSLIELLNHYLSTMSKYIHIQGGIIDKYIGDAIMALYFPNSSTKLSLAENACISALMMKQELIRFNRQQPENKNKIQAGIGINYGNCISGMIGSPQKRSLSVIGDSVNIASRIEGLTKVLGAAIIVSESLYSLLPENHNFILRPLGKYKLMGKSKPVALAELVCTDDNSTEVIQMKEEIGELKNALANYSGKKFEKAHAIFHKLYNQTMKQSRSKGYKYMAEYTSDLISKGVPKKWDGSFEIMIK
ncbi:MAG: tetratricopeptide repeat protein [Cyclobacteriaceae bacterium]|nr:tetratricopeptide repeat protein [Cyclobacteriaceae bacterium]MDH4297441.1 tetratricopeptide repeat protein [Cyclobacteriaceae bacterium]MDH5250209.1 tetratricopeptide repeat protein [Cyclobacteriaceae bacterium]